jgi:hypothetical protein
MQTGGKTLAFLIASSMLSACGGGGGGGGTVGPSQPLVTTTVNSWRDPVAGKNIKIDGLGKEVSYTFDPGSQLITSISQPPRDVSASATFVFDDTSALIGLFLTSGSTPVAAFDQISVMAADADFVTAASATSTAIMSNPKSTAWDYQSFGVWENGLDAGNGLHGAVSLGAPSPVGAIPLVDGATFTGKVVGSYVSAAGQGHTTVLANLAVGFDLGNNSLSFETTGTRISSDGTIFTLTPGLDMAGQTLTYAGTTNSFSGNLTTASGLTGNSTGQFYGPNAEELGGVFFLHGTGLETYSGAYGAKR